jgi:hypothetical protein
LSGSHDVNSFVGSIFDSLGSILGPTSSPATPTGTSANDTGHGMWIVAGIAAIGLYFLLK